MKNKFIITNEEFEAIKKAITEVLGLWSYYFIEANNGDGNSISMNKEVFFEGLKGEFIVKD